uniref:Uncharacterized protein n=1 Tax=Arundo donax TaxID=35708 RepID=A0A0A9C1U0_ARUDO
MAIWRYYIIIWLFDVCFWLHFRLMIEFATGRFIFYRFLVS